MPGGALSYRGSRRVIDGERPCVTKHRDASPYPVTSQAPRTGTQATGAVARSRASTGCGSVSSAATVTAAAALDARTLPASAGGAAFTWCYMPVGEYGHQDPADDQHQPEVDQTVGEYRGERR